MLTALIIAVFGWLFIQSGILALKLAWGLTKVIFVALLVLCLPGLVAALTLASGVVLFLPVCAVAVIFGILKLLI